MTTPFLHNEAVHRHISEDEGSRAQYFIKLPRRHQVVVLVANVVLHELVVGEVKERAAKVRAQSRVVECSKLHLRHCNTVSVRAEDASASSHASFALVLFSSSTESKDRFCTRLPREVSPPVPPGFYNAPLGLDYKGGVTLTQYFGAVWMIMISFVAVASDPGA